MPLDMGSIMSAGISGLYGIANSAISNQISREQSDIARQQNYRYGELSAMNADARTRKLYSDLYSPKAIMKQLKEAGLSPSLMGDNGIGGSGQTGAQSTFAGVNPQTYGIDPLAGAQIALMNAQTDKVKEETSGVKTENEIKDINKLYREIDFNLYKIDELAMTEYVQVNENERISIAEFANKCTSYENYINRLRQLGAPHQVTDTEQGQQTLRAIYKANNTLNRDIAVLSEEEINADFQKGIVKALMREDFANQSAETTIKELHALSEQYTLTESQNEAWNNMLDKLGNGTMRDIAIVLGMIINKFAGHTNFNYKGVHVKHSKSK